MEGNPKRTKEQIRKEIIKTEIIISGERQSIQALIDEGKEEEPKFKSQMLETYITRLAVLNTELDKASS